MVRKINDNLQSKKHSNIKKMKVGLIKTKRKKETKKKKTDTKKILNTQKETQEKQQLRL